MKKTLLAAAVLTLSLSASAQKTISIEDVCDAVVEKGKKYVVLEDLRDLAKSTAAKMWHGQSRNHDGHMVPDWGYLERNPVFVDIVLTVTPYLLYSGLLEDNQEYIDYAVWMVTSIWEIFYDKESGLVPQA